MHEVLGPTMHAIKTCNPIKNISSLVKGHHVVFCKFLRTFQVLGLQASFMTFLMFHVNLIENFVINTSVSVIS
jgi:hypothetical protein